MTSLSILRLLAEKAVPGPWVSETEVVHDGDHGLAVIARDVNVPLDATPTRGMVCWVHAGVGACETDEQALALAAYIAMLSPAFVLKMVAVCEAAVYAASDPEALDAALQRLKEE